MENPARPNSSGQGATAQDDSLSPRRNILRWLARGFLSLWGLAGLGVVVSFLKTPEAAGPGQRVVPAGPLSSLEVGDARLVRHGSRPLYVIRVSETEVLALSAICTHLQCVIGWSRERKALVCPCHAGVFDASGNVLSGLPRRSLERYPISLQRDQILIHLV